MAEVTGDAAGQDIVAAITGPSPSALASPRAAGHGVHQGPEVILGVDDA
jgi:hypothetical protein